MNRLPFWGSHERVCRENPNKPALPSQAVPVLGPASEAGGSESACGCLPSETAGPGAWADL